MIQNITIIGLGAIGTVYAAAFADAGVPARVAVDTQRLARYRDTGILFNGKNYDFDYYTPSTNDPEADLVIIATKSSGLRQALETIRPIVGRKTQILPLLNGITSEAVCASLYGWERVLYGYFIGHTSTRENNRIKQDGKYRTYFGESVNEQISERVAHIQSIFERANIPYKTPEDMQGSLWQKFIVNIGMNQATAVLRCTYGHLQTNSNAKEYMILLMKEAAKIAKAEGISNTEKMVEKAVSLLGDLSPEDGSSMYQDVISSRGTEVDLFADTVCTLGKKHGIDTPYNFHAGVILHSL